MLVLLPSLESGQQSLLLLTIFTRFPTFYSFQCRSSGTQISKIFWKCGDLLSLIITLKSFTQFHVTGSDSLSNQQPIGDLKFLFVCFPLGREKLFCVCLSCGSVLTQPSKVFACHTTKLTHKHTRVKPVLSAGLTLEESGRKTNILTQSSKAFKVLFPSICYVFYVI